MAEQDAIAAALARNDRFLVELVEAEGLCPYARATRLSGQLAREVLLGTPSAEALAERVAAHEAEDGGQIVLLILPDFAGEARAFERLCEELRRVDAARRPAVFAMAPFHPGSSYGTESPARLVGLFRRSPDPTIQLVRFSALDAVRRRAPDGKYFFDGSAAAWQAMQERPERGVSEQIAHDNWERCKDRDAELVARAAAIGKRTP